MRLYQRLERRITKVCGPPGDGTVHDLGRNHEVVLKLMRWAFRLGKKIQKKRDDHEEDMKAIERGEQE